MYLSFGINYQNKYQNTPYFLRNLQEASVYILPITNREKPLQFELNNTPDPYTLIPSLKIYLTELVHQFV